MKKLFSLMLALVLCMSLTVPALAGGEDNVVLIDANGTVISIDKIPGGGISYDESTKTLTLSGLQAQGYRLSSSRIDTIVLADGTKNTVSAMSVEHIGTDNQVTVKGSGELIISGSVANGSTAIFGLSLSFFGSDSKEGSFTFSDGLAMTGGMKDGASGALTMKQHDNLMLAVDASNTKAAYVRIGPAASTPAPAPETPAAPTVNFTDVAANSPFKTAIDWAVEKNITKGITATTFGPNNKCTNSHILTFLYRAFETVGTLPTEKENVQAWSETLGGAHFGDSPCNRIMAVDFIWRAAGCPEPTKSVSFTDLTDTPADSPSGKAISWAVEKGITTGTSATTFSPADHCTRGQIVTFLYRASQAGVL